MRLLTIFGYPIWQPDAVLRKLTTAYCLAALLLPTATRSELDRAAQLKTYMHMAAGSLGAPQRAALAKIEDDDKRDLAMTYYLRAGVNISSRWSWTAAQIENYQKSAAHAAALGELERIRSAFAENHPGYQLYANTQIRSLEEQLQRWQEVRSIAAPATQLRNDALAHLAEHSYVLVPDAVSRKRFIGYLITWRASAAPSLAAPGLSLHGRGRAYDFQVRDLKGRTVAGTDTATMRTV